MTDDVRLPEKWSRGSAGGPEWMTDLVPQASGDEYREGRWTRPLWRYEIAHNIKSPQEIAELRAFQLARRGRLRSFLLKDWLDFTSNADGDMAPTMLDQPLGIGTGAQTEFQLIKRYPDDVSAYERAILWPVAGTLVVAVDGVLKAAGVAVDRGTGIVTLTPAPAVDAVITAGFEFDVPVRFDDDWLSVTYDATAQRSAGSVPLQEVRS